MTHRLISNLKHPYVLVAVAVVLAMLLRKRAAHARLTVVGDRPQGVREVINPVTTVGGAEPETRNQARSNAPATVRTLDRAVSLSDFEEIVRAMPGVARARATRRADAHQKTVVVAVEGYPGAPLRPEDLQEIRRKLDRFRDPTVQVEVVEYVDVP